MLPCDSIHPLRRWRKAKDLTLKECAEAIGTSRQVWSDWERGIKNPSRRLLLRLRDFTKGEVSAEDFLPKREVSNGNFSLPF